MLEFFGFETGAFSQLTQKYMKEEFNPNIPDREGVSYYSYGASCKPRLWSMFRQSHRIIQRVEGDNDGLVSVSSSRWGTYKGTLKDVSHLDMINWTNRLRWFMWELSGNKRTYVAYEWLLAGRPLLTSSQLQCHCVLPRHYRHARKGRLMSAEKLLVCERKHTSFLSGPSMLRDHGWRARLQWSLQGVSRGHSSDIVGVSCIRSSGLPGRLKAADLSR